MEAARVKGLFCAAVLTDLMKAYEHVLHAKLVVFAKDTRFPLGLLRMCLACYAGPRRLVVDGYCAAPFCIGGKSLNAGCGFATTFLKVYTIKLFDMMWRWYPELSLYVFVDDVDINNTAESAEASSREVAKGTQRLLTEFKRVLGLKAGISKCVLLGSTPAVRNHLTTAMAALPRGQQIKVKPWGKKLGIQFAIQNRRQAALLRHRRHQAGTRAARIRTLRAAIPRRSRNQIYNSACRPVATYGGACWGFPDSAIKDLRSQASVVCGGASRFRSARLLGLLEPRGLVAPAVEAHVLPIAAWARSVWMSRIGVDDLSDVLQLARRTLDAATEPWKSVTGPGQAFINVPPLRMDSH